jgi:hypothetical protein
MGDRERVRGRIKHEYNTPHLLGWSVPRACRWLAVQPGRDPSTRDRSPQPWTRGSASKPINQANAHRPSRRRRTRQGTKPTTRAISLVALRHAATRWAETRTIAARPAPAPARRFVILPSCGMYLRLLAPTGVRILFTPPVGARRQRRGGQVRCQARERRDRWSWLRVGGEQDWS